MNRKTVLVAGGGAAGLMAAVCAARQGARVTVLEKMDRVGKKILATGNGRCNLLNVGPLRFHGDKAFAAAVLEHMDAQKVADFFESMGLSLREEEDGRVYPASGLASSVLDVLRLGCISHGVEIVCGATVQKIERKSGTWTAYTREKYYNSNAIIITGGGKAAPKLGSDGTTYSLLQSQGHKLIAPKPAITQLRTETEPIRGLAGIRVRAELILEKMGVILAKEWGELLFTEYGVSGVAAMQLAREAAGAVLHINLHPALNIDSVGLHKKFSERAARFAGAPLEQFFLGLTHARLGIALMKRAGIGPLSRSCGSLAPKEISALCDVIADFSLVVTGVQGFDNAQVTAGGIDTCDFDSGTMASRLAENLYAAGEVLNVDGDCGGFNLLFAWASGMLAGEHAGKFNPPEMLG